MTASPDTATGQKRRPGLIYRQNIFTRITHWVWVICLFFLLLTGLQIFNAHPGLYVGHDGYDYTSAVFQIGAERQADGTPRGFTRILGAKFDTTGVLGMSGSSANPQFIGFPAWATIPSFRDLATGRVVHFFFAWIFVTTILVWLIASLINRHLVRDVVPNGRDLRRIGPDIIDHLKFRFSHGGRYNVLQKVSYSVVLLIFFPLMVLTGLAMSPGMDSAWPWLLQVLGGRQTARLIHFLTMSGLVAFFVIHIVMVVLAGPINELRSMITGWYKVKHEERADV